MQVNINSGPGRPGVVSSEVQERIKSRSWIGIQKCLPQPRLADFAHGQILAFIPRITEAQLPVPRLEIIGKFSHFAAQANIEEIIVVGEFFVPGAGVVNAAKLNSGSYGKAASVREKTWNSRIRDREGIKRILDWHTDAAAGIKVYVRAWHLEWIGRKGHSCVGRIEK